MTGNAFIGLIVRWQSWTAASMLSHLWQASLAGLIVSALMIALRGLSARTRWSIGWIGLMSFLLPGVWLTRNPTPLDSTRLQPWTYLSRSIPEQPDLPTASAPPAAALAAHAPASPVARPPLSLQSWALGAWALGSAILIGLWAVRGYRFRGPILARCEPVPALLQRHFERAREQAGLVRAPRCAVLQGADGPGVIGILSPIVILPRNLNESLTSAEIEAVLLHEFIHVRRRDTLLAALQAIIVRLFWFDPVVWLLDRRLNLEVEKSCDEAVLALSTNAGTYANGILKIVRHSLGLKAPGYAGIGSVPIAHRLKNILDYSAGPRRRWAKLAAVGAALATLAMAGFGGSINAEATGAAPAGRVLVFRDIPSWNRTPDFEAVLGNLGIPFSSKRSSEMTAADLSDYSVVVIPGAQWHTDFYSNFDKAAARFDDYVKSGGTLLLELNGAEDGNVAVPGGVVMVKDHSGFFNIIVQPDHPALASFRGRPFISASLASHGYLKHLPANATVLAEVAGPGHLLGDPAKPTYVEYDYGSGHVIAACQCFHDRDGSHRGTLMPAAITYAMGRSWYKADPGAKQSVAAAVDAITSAMGDKLAGIAKREAEVNASGGAAPAGSDGTLASGMRAVGSLTNAGTDSPRALAETMVWAGNHGDISELTNLITLDSDAKALAGMIYEALPADTKTSVTSPEAIMAELISYQYPTGVGFQIQEDRSINGSPTDWAVSARVEMSSGKIENANFRMKKVGGAWRTVVGPGNVEELGKILLVRDPLPPPEKD